MSPQALRTVELYWGETEAQGEVRIVAKNQVPRACFQQAAGGCYGPKEKRVAGCRDKY
jgi:hypothetical protein